ncbi:MAG: hypothetical protein HY542_06320 [Deltaproteobacteria bacterium]|nr:hypothetical protein [Deltaproteobacteria bacterium]
MHAGALIKSPIKTEQLRLSHPDNPSVVATHAGAYDLSDLVNPVMREGSPYQVLRGGSWCSVVPGVLRAGYRNGGPRPGGRAGVVGFRLAAAL